MKRLFVLGFAIMALGVSAFAQSESKFVEKLNEKSTLNRVSNYVGADYVQEKDLKYIFDESSKRFDKAIAEGINETEAVKKAINFNLANARVILTDYQYRKFLRVLNEINNETNPSLYAEK